MIQNLRNGIVDNQGNDGDINSTLPGYIFLKKEKENQSKKNK